MLPENIIVVPIPTIAPHIRERGYDQTKLIAKYVANQINRPFETIIQRKTNSMQRGASKKQRERQARQAFGLTNTPGEDSRYLLVDDVVTTGSTLRFAAKALRDAGATTVWVAVIARQPLD
jgi:ComF family protein